MGKTKAVLLIIVLIVSVYQDPVCARQHDSNELFHLHDVPLSVCCVFASEIKITRFNEFNPFLKVGLLL